MKLKYFSMLTGMALLAVNAVSEDIEIYTATTGTGEAGQVNPNVLFIMDTSGSMSNSVPVAFANYDFDTDYGSSDDDLIYVYDTNLTYQNIFYDEDQVVCQAMLDFHDSNPSLPLYSGQTLQWGPVTETTGAVVCDPEDLSESLEINQVIDDSNNTIYQVFIPLADLDAGTTVEVVIENTGNRTADVELGYWYQNGGGNNRASNTCDVDVVAGDIGGCFGTSAIAVDDIPATVTNNNRTVLGVRVRIEANNNNQSTSIVGAVTYNIGSVGEADPGCVPDAGTTVTYEDWTNDLFMPTASDQVLECEADAGVHGLSNATTQVYATWCPDDTCTTPRYTSNAPGIDWTSNGIDAFYFVDANFHDYLNSTTPNPENNVGDAEDFCDNNGNQGRFIEDANDGIVYQCQHKGEIMQNAANDLAETLTDVNVGLMRFYDAGLSGGGNRDGGSVVLAMDTIDSSVDGEAQRTAFQNAIDGLNFAGHTPLMETLYEAHLYYANKPTLNAQSNTDTDAYTGGSASAGTYVSPITHSCQTNNIVYLTDGVPWSDGDDTVETAIGTLLSTVTPAIEDQSCSYDDSGDSNGDNCLDELAEYMANGDHSGTVEGDNPVNLYTIGFDIDLPILNDAASKGNGEYFVASDYLELQRAFQSILVDIALSSPTALVAPAVSVNAFNELQHRDQIYYAVFEPASSPRWQGNVKKYRIANGDVLDANNSLAINPVTGFFAEGSRSYWSDETDSANVQVGGMREQFTNDRRIFVDGAALASPQAGIVELDDSLELSLAAANVSSAVEAIQIRDWILGEDVDDTNDDSNTTDAHRYAADSLHSQPFVITYRGSSEANAEDVLFVATNQGFLHAVDARDDQGTELWSYIPADLVGNSSYYLENAESDSHVYGLDGEATIYTEESSTSSPTNFELETVQIFQGMRRGGRNYYAWDVSNALSTTNTPISTMWTINGGATTGFENLGQTWSKMIRTKLSVDCDADGTGCTTRDVLVFSGGYDTYYDDATATEQTGSSTVTGNSLYVVDAATGNLLWSAGDINDGHDLGLPMYNSIPASPTPVDIDADGDMDILFAVDITGKIWRIDFDQTASTPINYAQGGMIADLTTSGFRRFYNALDASLSTPRGGPSYFNLVVGSGYRAHPKDVNEATNALFVVFDENVSGPKDDNDDGTYEYGYNASGNVISFAGNDLYEVTSSAPAVKDVNAELGFYIPLDGADEKILQQTTTFNGRVTVASYLPEGGSTQEATCGTGNTGGGRAYVFDLDSGETIFSTELQHDGIPASASFMLQEEGGLTICFGTECTDGSGTGMDGDGDDGFFDDDALCNNPLNVVDAQCFGAGQAYRTYWREN